MQLSVFPLLQQLLFVSLKTLDGEGQRKWLPDQTPYPQRAWTHLHNRERVRNEVKAALDTSPTATAIHAELWIQLIEYKHSQKASLADNYLEIYLTSCGGRGGPLPFNHACSANGKGKWFCWFKLMKIHANGVSFCFWLPCIRYHWLPWEIWGMVWDWHGLSRSILLWRLCCTRCRHA